MASNLDTFLPLLSTPDTKRKLQIGQDLLQYLRIEENTLDCENIGAFIDSIIHWLNNSNFKVTQSGLEILANLAIRMKEDLKPYLSSILGPTIDRLGDSKECVRDQAKNLLEKLMSFVSTPQIILEKLMPAFSHKNWKVREEICLFFQECLLRYGVVGSINGQLYVSKFIPSLVNLLSDPNSQVRDTSMTTLVAIYKHVGDKLRNEILRKHATNMPQQKLQTLLAKFDEIANTGEGISNSILLNSNNNNNNNIISNNSGGNNNNKIVPKNRSNLTNNNTNISNNANGNGNHVDEVDFKKINTFKRATSAPPTKRNLNKLPPSSSNKSSGAADEEMFMNSFEDVPRIQIFSVKDLEQELNRIRDVCSNPNMEWEKRIECLKKFRSLLIAGASDYEEFYHYLKPLEVPFQTSVKDLRSQVVREACISIAYLSQRIGNKCDRFAEALLPTLIDSIQNSAKIMSSSAVVAIRFVIQHTHTSRLIPILTYNISSKSKEIRKACCEFLDQLLHTWPPQTLEKHVGLLQEAIKKGISDADPEARALARKAFWGFADKFKNESDYLLSSLDSSKQRMLQGEQMSNWSSTNSLNKVSTYSRPITTTNRTNSTNGSIESINRHCNLLKRSAIPISSSPRATTTPRTPVKATSAIDIDAQRRARAKANTYLNQPKVFLNSVYSLNHAKKAENITPTMIDSRTPRKNSRVSKSQPGSRSASPSSRINCYGGIPSSSTTTAATTTSSTIKSKRTSRDQSPARTNNNHRFERKLSSSSTATTSRSKSYLTTSDLDLSNNRILQQNEHEQMIQNALMTNVTPRKKYFDEQSDESETSSICSDTSFANYGVIKTELDISKILDNLSSTHWTDKRDGLLELNKFLRFSNESLNSFQLKRITDIFTRMLVDPHTKAFSVFLNTLNELIHIYKNELNSWLYILMTRLFLKIGSDTLTSIQTRIGKTFELIRESFPIEHQFNVIMRLLSDQTQTLNTKVKIAVLQYLSKLLFLMDSSDFTFNRANNHDIQTALIKIISWTADIKCSELRKISQDTIVDLYNLNSTEMTLYLNELRKTYQDAALQIIQHKHKTRLSQTPTSGMMQTPFIVKNMSSSSSSAHKTFCDPNEPYNPADIYDSLRKTSDEIQKYSFNLDSETLSPINNNNTNSNSNLNNNNNNANNINNINSNNYVSNNIHNVDSRRFDALSNASLDSGISQNSTLISDLTPTSAINHRTMQIINNNNNINNINNYHHTQSPPTNGYNPSNISMAKTNGYGGGGGGNYGLFGPTNDDFIANFSLLSIDDDSFQQNLIEIYQIIKNYSPDDISLKFKNLYQTLLNRLLLEKHNNNNNQLKILILRTMGQILYRSTRGSFNEFAETTLTLLIEMMRYCKDDDKEVLKVSEETANDAIYNFDPITSFKILQPYFNHEDSSLNKISIKLLTKMIESNRKEIVSELLPELMPQMLQAYDNKESAVRKTAVFCMVAIYGAVGNEMNAFLSSLSHSKMKLLQLYIDRSIQTNNNSTTTNSIAPSLTN